MSKRNDSVRVRNKILAVFMVFILLSTTVEAGLGEFILNLVKKPLGAVINSWKYALKNPGKLLKGWGMHIMHEEAESKGERTRNYLYVIFYGLVTKDITTDISANINDYVLMNPDPFKPGVKSSIYLFVRLLTPFYILALVSLGVYTMFLSTSPKGRARAKSMITRLLIGMVLVTVSPHLLGIFFGLSHTVTNSILVEGETDVVYAVDTYSRVMWDSWWLTAIAITGIDVIDIFTLGGGLAMDEAGKEILKPIQESVGTGVHGLTPKNTDKSMRMWLKWKVKSEPSLGKSLLQVHKNPVFMKSFGEAIMKARLGASAGRTIPMLMLTLTLFAGVYGVLAFRYLMVMFFTLIFPFTVFFLCFDPTKKLGGTLLEQLLLWTLIQEFYAITLVAVGIGIASVPPDIAVYGPGPFTGFFDHAACFTLMLTPIILFMLLRKLIPPL